MINAGKATANDRNNNPAMVSDLVGDDDDYGDEYYGDETEYKGRLPENEHDFM